MKNDFTAVDLSLSLHNGTIVFPGEEPVNVEQTMHLGKDVCNLHQINITTHSGTHLDFPYHMLNDGNRLDSFPIGDFFFHALKIDVRPENPEEYTEEIRPEQIFPFKSKLSTINAVVFHTGFDRIMKTGNTERSFSYLNKESVNLLMQYPNIRLIGIDSLSADPLDSLDAHHAFLGDNRLLLEKLINLELVPEKFILIALPLPLGPVDGSPCRAVGLIKNII